MFATACSEVSSFTRPVVISRVTVSGKVTSSVATFIVVNDHGWILTAGHLAPILARLSTEATREGERAAAGKLTGDARRVALKKLGKVDPDATKHFSIWWSWDQAKAVEGHVVPEWDLALVRLEPFDSKAIPSYPRFKDSSKSLRMGTSLCRLGFPFPELQTAYAGDPPAFHFDHRGHLALFPIEGVLTRNILVAPNPGGALEPRFIETSSPGLMGQSGGPIFDSGGRVWAMQSQTASLPLGFDTKGPDNKPVHQFLNVGWGVHPERILQLLREKGVDFTLADE